MIKGRRYDELRKVLIDREDVIKVELDEDFIPPHKQAGTLPYDVVIFFTEPVYGSEDKWTEDSVIAILESHGLEYDEVKNVEEHTRGEATQKAFISLHNPHK